MAKLWRKVWVGFGKDALGDAARRPKVTPTAQRTWLSRILKRLSSFAVVLVDVGRVVSADTPLSSDR
jgi:hypothetical protein